MRWLQTEYLLKGLYLGLVVYAALLMSDAPAPHKASLLEFNLVSLGGLGVCLFAAALLKTRAGYRPVQGVGEYLLFLMLESPVLVYTGIIGGAGIAAYFLLYPLNQPPLALNHPEMAEELLWPTLGGGLALGLVLNTVRQVRKREVRLAVILLLAAVAVVALLAWFDTGEGGEGAAKQVKDPTVFAIQLLLGLPLFYLLSFAGQEEESEVEIGVMCAVISLAVGVLTRDHKDFQWAVVLGPVILYLWYTFRVLPPLRIYKHTLRGYAHGRIGRHARALRSFRRALQLDPRAALARKGFWHVHTTLDIDRLSGDKELLGLVDFELCLERAGGLLIEGKPTEAQMSEARRLLDLVVSQRRDKQPAVDYWRAVALLHENQVDQAAGLLERVLDPATYGGDNRQRQAVLFPAWQLGLLLHRGLRERVGEPQLAQPGRRIEAIAAVERHIADNGAGGHVMELKKLLYGGLTEAEYREAVGVAAPSEQPPQPPADAALPEPAAPATTEAGAVLHRVQGMAESAGTAVQGAVRDLAEKAGAAVPWSLRNLLGRSVGGFFGGGRPPAPLKDFDYTFAREVGVGLVKDPGRWLRGAELLRIAADGLPGHRPTLFVEIAKAYQRAEDEEGALEYFGLARQSGRAYGVKNLGAADANAYFATVKYLGELAMFKGDLEGAVENLRLLMESPNAGADTYGKLAEAYEKLGDFFNAMRYNETALQYRPSDPHLRQRKEHYYFNLSVEQLKANLTALQPFFDFNYCLTRAKTILDNPAYSGAEWLEVAVHLMSLATVVESNSFRARLLQARVKLRLGERDEGQSILEKIRDPRPESFASGEEETAWFHAQQALGDLYMEIGRPDLAIQCYATFRESHLSGAKTVYKMGQAFEQTGDVARAIKCYKLVTGYEGNPLVWDARQALSRLQAGGTAAG